MKKDNYRDYTADAFRYYAQCGKPDSEQLRQMRAALPAAQRGAMGDLEAVARVLERLELSPDGERDRLCLELVYFAQPRHYPSRGAISERVQAAADELCISVANVYRILQRLRTLFAVERGLRVSDCTFPPADLFRKPTGLR